MIRRLLCLLGFHKFEYKVIGMARLYDVVSTVGRCKYCGKVKR